MSLRVWLPLTKDLRNQGLDGTPITFTGAINLNDNGKLGKCYKTSNTGVIDLKYSGAQINTGSLSLCGWFKFNKAELAATWESYSFNSSYPYPTGNLIGNNSYGGVGLIWYTNSLASGAAFTSLYAACSIRSTTNGARITNVVTIPFDTWVHLALIFNKATKALELWMNGELKVTSTMLDFNDARADNLKLNYSAVWGGNGPSYNIPFLVNDVRIYDHALSSMEVKELSKGLVLHYPLNRGGWGQENLFKVNCCSGGNRATFLENGRRVKIDWTSNAGDTYWYLGLASGVTLTEGKTYTLSFQCSGLGSNVVSFKWCNLANYEVYLKKGLNTFTFAMPSTNITNPFFDDLNRDTSLSDLELWDFKLEEGSIATPWCPNSSDALATAMGLNGTTEYDCSGYCNNGVRTGAFSWTSDTPKYQVSTYMPKAALITHPRPVFGGTDQEWTCAMWVKLDATSQANQYMNNFNAGNQIVYGANSYPLLYLNSGTNDYYNYGNKVVAAGAWTHVVFVFKNSNATKLIYINGVEQTNKNGPNKTSTPLGIPDTVTVGTNLAGYISDYRIYATALSADDVKSLYQNSAYIDSSGNVYGAVH